MGHKALQRRGRVPGAYMICIPSAGACAPRRAGDDIPRGTRPPSGPAQCKWTARECVGQQRDKRGNGDACGDTTSLEHSCVRQPQAEGVEGELLQGPLHNGGRERNEGSAPGHTHAERSRNREKQQTPGVPAAWPAGRPLACALWFGGPGVGGWESPSPSRFHCPWDVGFAKIDEDFVRKRWAAHPPTHRPA